MAFGGFVRSDDVAGERREEVGGAVGCPVFDEVALLSEVIAVGFFEGGPQGGVLDRFPDLDGVDVDAEQGGVDVTLFHAVGAEVVTFDDQLQVLEIDVLAVHLPLDGISPTAQGIDFAFQRRIAVVAGNVFPQGGEGDDDGGDDHQEHDEAEGHDDEPQQVYFEIDDRRHTLVVRHQDIIPLVQFLERESLPPPAFLLFVLSCFRHRKEINLQRYTIIVYSLKKADQMASFCEESE